MIKPDGHNVTITGENGAGKSSIMYAWQWVLGLDVGEVRPIIDGMPVLPTTFPNVTVTFDNDVSICRVFQGSSSKYYFADVLVPTKAAYLAKIAELLNTKYISIFSQLGYFATMDMKQRRQLLLSMCSVSNADVLATNDAFAEIYDQIERDSIEDLQKSVKSQVKVLKEKLQGIPFEIKGLQYSFNEDLGDKAQLKSDLALLNAELKALENTIKTLQQESSTEPPVDYNAKIHKLQPQKTLLYGKVQSLQTRLNMLRTEYKAIANSKPGFCPHCGQAISLKTFITKRDKKIADINLEGRKINAELATFNEQLQEIEVQLQILQNAAAQNNSQSSSDSQRLASHFQKKLQLERDISNISRQLEQIREQEHRDARIAELKKEQAQLEDKIAALNEKLQLIKDFQLAKCRLIEQQINNKFQIVKFKLFDFYVTSGEIKDCCEVLMDDKPYSTALSTGERVKASLDCIKTLQEHFKVELPIFIDDAESITSNSSAILANFPNQLFLLKVVEGQNLTIKVNKI